MSLFDKLIAASLPIVPKPIVRKVADPYIAGERIEDFLRVSKDMNAHGFMVAGAILGEFVSTREEAAEAVREYQGFLRTLSEHQVDAYIHIKPTHLGLLIDHDMCVQNVRAVLGFAKPLGLFVRLDMEDSPCIDGTLRVYDEVRGEFDNVGVVIQSRMRRSLDDVRELAKVKANVRVCKGIYIEPPQISYTDPEIIRSSFMALVEELLAAGSYVGIATHDERLVFESERLIDRLNVPRSGYEFQMLLGVLPELRDRVHERGHRLRIAVPYGAHWYAYSVRRLRKNPAVAGYVLKALFHR